MLSFALPLTWGQTLDWLPWSLPHSDLGGFGLFELPQLAPAFETNLCVLASPANWAGSPAFNNNMASVNHIINPIRVFPTKDEIHLTKSWFDHDLIFQYCNQIILHVWELAHMKFIKAQIECSSNAISSSSRMEPIATGTLQLRQNVLMSLTDENWWIVVECKLVP